MRNISYTPMDHHIFHFHQIPVLKDVNIFDVLDYYYYIIIRWSKSWNIIWSS
jgi:hypothetical protein